MAAHDSDLSSFQKAGGKMISWHGLADETIPPVTSRYYDQVMERVSDVHQFYRHFEAPGVGHCMGGFPLPRTAFDPLINWVEEGVVPDKLKAVGQVGRKGFMPLSFCTDLRRRERRLRAELPMRVNGSVP